MSDWDAVVAAVTTALTGDKGMGREQLLACWGDTDATDHAHRCVLAHYLADLEAELDREVAWDRTALAEHADVGDADLAAIGIPSARGMLPSLHLNLGDGLLRGGDVSGAGQHLDEGLAACDALGHDGYAAMVRGGLERLRARLDEARHAGP